MYLVGIDRNVETRTLAGTSRHGPFQRHRLHTPGV